MRNEAAMRSPKDGLMAPTRQTRRNRRHVLLVQSWWEDRVLRGVASYAAEKGWALDCRMR